jgi:hypothetical protein
MRNNQIAVVLAGLLLLSTLLTAWLTLYYTRSVQKAQKLQPRAVAVGTSRNLIQALITDTMEYSKKNHEIDPILQQVGLKPGGKVAAPAPASASKPPTK